ncbi:MAG: DNA-binding protein [Hydrogenobacter thermophilus]|uniref:DNA-binding protein n=1 Tax=Hydrogenobacter thermophilus TaxID=940 RepID=UPI001C762ABF|nr:DNA-binding protein [Hydrogenobacter thermophilus]QWK20279.1 MAG: DNA-binding protein [Hydrogenobacter thermophilus]
MRLSRKLSFLALLILSQFIIGFNIACSRSEIPAEEAINYVGQKKTVCGVVASVKYARRVRGQPTFINLGKPYPNQDFTFVIWGEDRDKFSSLLEEIRPGRELCSTGLIKLYHGKPEMILSSPSQVKTR